MRVKVIKLRKKNKVNSRIYHIIVGYKYKGRSKLLVFKKIGMINLKHPKLMFINSMLLGYWLNKGAILNKTVKKFLINICFNK